MAMNRHIAMKVIFGPREHNRLSSLVGMEIKSSERLRLAEWDVENPFDSDIWEEQVNFETTCREYERIDEALVMRRDLRKSVYEKSKRAVEDHLTYLRTTLGG